MENKEKIITALLVINLFIGIMGITKVNNFNQELVNIKGNLNMMSDEISYISRDIHQEINDALMEEANYIENFKFDYQYQEVEVDKKELPIVISFKVKEKQADSEIYLVYYKQDELENTEVMLQPTNSLTYQTTLDLDYTYNYTVDMIEKMADGSVKKLNAYTHNIWLQEQMKEQRVEIYSEGFGSRLSEGVVFQLVMQDYGMEQLGLEKVEIVIMNEEQEIDRVDITNQLSEEPFDEMAFSSNEAEKIILEKAIQEKGYSPEQTVDPQVYYGRFEYQQDDKAQEGWIHFSIVITCKDGLVINEWQ